MRTRLFRLVMLTLPLATMRDESTVHAQGPAVRFDTVSLRADLDHLHQRLLRMHPAPDMYAGREALERGFDSLHMAIKAPMDAHRFLAHISALHPLLGDGHTMFLPADDATPALHLPLDVVYANGRLHVLRNGTTDHRILPGAEILSVNGVPAQAVMDTLMRRQIRDGRNNTYPRWILNKWFRPYYRQSFGQPSRFELVLRAVEGELHVTVDALASDSIHANFDRSGRPDREAATFGSHFEPRDSIAVLTVPSFEKGNLSYRMIDAAFDSIRKWNARALVLDLRDDQGGEPGYAKRLLAHLLDRPFELVHDGPASGEVRPVRDPFRGPVVVLMNGGSFSATGMVLSCLQRHNRATFIGEESGGNRTVLAGSPKHVLLPNTRLNCYISTRVWQLCERPNDGHGVIPDIEVHPTIDDLVNGRDVPFEEALRHARQHR